MSVQDFFKNSAEEIILHQAIPVNTEFSDGAGHEPNPGGGLGHEPNPGGGLGHEAGHGFGRNSKTKNILAELKEDNHLSLSELISSKTR